VFYPGLPSHPGHDIAARQQQGFGAIVTLGLLTKFCAGNSRPDPVR